jgi:DNA-binding response OmpR family regulator
MVLLVEDEPVVADALSDALTQQGFEVRVAPSGSLALEQIAGGDRFDAIVTDIMLEAAPQGWSIAKEARERNPAAVVVYITGQKAPEHYYKGVPFSSMLQKPFDPDELLDILLPLQA